MDKAYSENNRLLGVSGYIGRRWYIINAIIAYLLGHSTLKIMQLVRAPALLVYALVPLIVFYIYGLVYRRAVDILGGKRWRWLPMIVAVGILLPVADLFLSGFMMFIPGQFSGEQTQSSSWRFHSQQVIAIAASIILSATVIVLAPSVNEPRLSDMIENSNSSMEPTLGTGKNVRIQKEFSPISLRRGTIVALNLRGKLSLKRVIGVAGDTVRFSGHVIWLNEKQIQQSVPKNAAELLANIPDKNIENSNEENIKFSYEIRRENLESNSYLILQRKENLTSEFLKGQVKIDSGMIWVLGDNRDNSLDSRMSGPVTLNDVIGIVQQEADGDKPEH